MIRTILITSVFVFGWQAHAKNKRKVASYPVHHEFIKIHTEKKTSLKKNICIIKTKETGKLKVKAPSYKQAFSLGIESCFQKQNQFFMKGKSKYPSQHEQIKFVNTCVDNIHCIGVVAHKPHPH